MTITREQGSKVNVESTTGAVWIELRAVGAVKPLDAGDRFQVLVRGAWLEVLGNVTEFLNAWLRIS